MGEILVLFAQIRHLTGMPTIVILHMVGIKQQYQKGKLRGS